MRGFTILLIASIALLVSTCQGVEENDNGKLLSTKTPRQLSCNGEGSDHPCTWDCWVGCTRRLQDRLIEMNNHIENGNDEALPTKPRQLSCDGEGSDHPCSWDCWVGCTRRLQEKFKSLHRQLEAHNNRQLESTNDVVKPRQLSCDGEGSDHPCSWDCWVGCTRRLQNQLINLHQDTQEPTKTIF